MSVWQITSWRTFWNIPIPTCGQPNGAQIFFRCPQDFPVFFQIIWRSSRAVLEGSFPETHVPNEFGRFVTSWEGIIQDHWIPESRFMDLCNVPTF
eukprot:11739949-Karenia_brevis.AAC.1